MKKNVIYAQSGGMTAVINASACGLIKKLKKSYKDRINKIYVAKNGILGILKQELIDITNSCEKNIDHIMNVPSGIFGSCRYKIKTYEEYKNIFSIFQKYNIGYFFYNGGGDSLDTIYKIFKFSHEIKYSVICIGIPKTIDNDIPYTDTCPGFGSAAKYIAISTMEAGLDIASISNSSTKIFILEVMGRYSGWLAAASGLAKINGKNFPHIILFPEIIFKEKIFLKKVKYYVEKYGYCIIVVSEGIKNNNGNFISNYSEIDDFNHIQLGGSGFFISTLIRNNLKYKCHLAIIDYLQRSARHIASQIDLNQSYILGKESANLAFSGYNAVMPIIKRKQDSPYIWYVDHIDISLVINKERRLPIEFIDIENMYITNICKQYIYPLIQGEAYPEYYQGLPIYDIKL